MSDISERLEKVENRLALQDLITRYCNEIDNLENVEAVVDCFTDDAVLDLSGLDLPKCEGKANIRDFFTEVFDSMTHEAHYSTNFTIHEMTDSYARCHAYVIGMGVATNGTNALVHARHNFEARKTEAGWRIQKFSEPLMLPLPGELEELYK